MINTCLIQFAKAPVLGKVKTRLALALSEQQRNELHCAMTAWTCEQLQQATNAVLELWVDGDCEDPFFQQLYRQFNCELFTQTGADLGERMQYACSYALESSKNVVIVGSDCPFITANTIAEAINSLKNKDFVFVPANDGGYVLLAMKVFEQSLFKEIAWGSDTVLTTSLQKLNKAGRTYTVLSPLPDIDRPEDLAHLDNPKLPPTITKFAS